LLYLGLVFAPWFRLRGAAPRGFTRETVFIHLYLTGLILYLVVISAGPEANYRFRLPLVPLLAIYAATGWDKVAQGAGWGWRRWQSFGSKPERKNR
jgi:hypothetical protein